MTSHVSPVVMGFLALIFLTGVAEAQPKQFRNGSVVLTGPELSPSWGDWAFFPYTLAEQGSSISGSIRIFPGRSLARTPESERRDVAREMIREIPELALISVSEPGRQSSVFPAPVGEEENKKAMEENRETRKPDGVFVPLARRDTQWLLASGESIRFRLERLSAEEFSLTLEPDQSAVLQHSTPEGETAAARLRALPPKEYKFEEQPLSDVVRLRAEDCGISLQVPEDSVQALLQRVTYSERNSPFVVLEKLARQYAAQVSYSSGSWVLLLRPLTTRFFCPRGDNYWGIVVSRGGDVRVTLD